MDSLKENFTAMCHEYKLHETYPFVPKKSAYSNIEIINYIRLLQGPFDIEKHREKFFPLAKGNKKCDKETMIQEIEKINKTLLEMGSSVAPIQYKKLKKSEIKVEIDLFFEKMKNASQTKVSTQEIAVIKGKIDKINEYINQIQPTLDKHVYGHKKAKRQIERILAQWINHDDDSFNEGYVLGFEGNPGIGKTTLAKGLSQCLVDENGTSRPFSIIAMGGSCNASTLVGHSYTYVGSNWGDIVQILIDKKCMNPIILIDEVDKISKTTNSRTSISRASTLTSPRSSSSCHTTTSRSLIASSSTASIASNLTAFLSKTR
jgi:ATP-dependent Lon protease